MLGRVSILLALTSAIGDFYAALKQSFLSDSRLKEKPFRSACKIVGLRQISSLPYKLRLRFQQITSMRNLL